METNKIIVDLDGTITIDNPSLDYSDKEVNWNIVEALKIAKLNKYQIVIHTARNMKTYNGDIDKIHEYTKPKAIKWLKKNKVPFDDVKFGKPWSGKVGYYVDDRALHPEEFSFRFLSYFSDKTVDIVVSFFNESAGVFLSHKNILKSARLLNIKNYIYVNNGSTDDTLKILNEIAEQDSRVKVINNIGSKGYGDGYRAGFSHSTADIIMTNHGDNQFDIYLFLLLYCFLGFFYSLSFSCFLNQF